MKEIPWHEVYDLARERGMKEHFELTPKAALIVFNDDSKYIKDAKWRANGQHWSGQGDTRLEFGELYMQRDATADDLFNNWTGQGYTSLLMKQSATGYYGPLLGSRLHRLLQTLDIGQWTFCRVERSWSVVFATEREADIKQFASLITKR